MTREDVAKAFYEYMLSSAAVRFIPVGYRVASWDELKRAGDRTELERWRGAADLYLDAIGVTQSRGQAIVFDGLPPDTRTADPEADQPQPQEEADRGPSEHRITPDGG